MILRLTGCCHFPVPLAELLLYQSVPHSRSIFSGTRKPGTGIRDVLKVDDSNIKADFFLIKPTDALISKIYFVKKLYIYRAVSLPIIRSFPLYIWHWYIQLKLQNLTLPMVPLPWQLDALPSYTSRSKNVRFHWRTLYHAGL